MTLTLAAADLPDTPVENGAMSPRSDRPGRRSFTAKYKLDMLAECDAADAAARGCCCAGTLCTPRTCRKWRRARDSGALACLTAPARPARTSVEQRELAKATAHAERAERELAKTRAALEIVGKAHALLEMLSESADTELRSRP